MGQTYSPSDTYVLKMQDDGNLVVYKVSNGTATWASNNHTHSYLPLSGGTLTGSLTLSNSTGIWFNGNGDFTKYPYMYSTGCNIVIRLNQTYWRIAEDGIYNGGNKVV